MADIGRTRQSFPSRQYSHGVAHHTGLESTQALGSGRTVRFVLGRDLVPQPIDSSAVDRPRDLFATRVLFGGQDLPLSLRTLLAHLDSLDRNPLPVQRSFVVADGGQIPWTSETDDLQRNFRLVVTRHPAAGQHPDVMVSASTNLDSASAFLQVVSWDDELGAFQFYDRRDDSWIWAGSSWDALAPDSRGQGPFDSHVNGALNMKELKRPWVHWHSPAARILDSALAPDDPLAAEPLWVNRGQADEFERAIARPGIQRWTAARIERRTRDGRLTSLPEFMRQVLDTSTINLAASPLSQPALAGATTVPLPLTFFVNSDALIDVLDLDPALDIPRVSAAVYRDILRRYQVGITDGRFRFEGDTHFLFIVPEAAYEDVHVLQRLLERGILSRKLAASLLMVDFRNPVFSARRRALMRHVPADAALGAAAVFDTAFIGAIRATIDAGEGGAAESELLANWSLSEAWQSVFEDRIAQFVASVASTIDEPDCFARIFELAESRRREFRKRPLAEFRLTTPVTNIPEDAPLLEFADDGTVRQKAMAPGGPL